MADFMKVSLDGDFEAGLDRLASDIKEKVIRAGSNAAAFVFQEEAKTLAPVFHLGPKNGGASLVKRGKVKPGQLQRSIYRVHHEQTSSDALQVYDVSWNHYKAPHGHWMEFGNARHPAHPFLRPAYESAKGRALQAGIDRIAVKFAEVVTGKP